MTVHRSASPPPGATPSLVAGVVLERFGTGEPLVLVHGIGSRRQVWAPLLPLLTPHREVVVLDLPGFGDSPAPGAEGGRSDVAAHADAVEGVIAALGLERPHVAGNSLGGGIALELGRRGLASRVTAFAPVGFWTGAGARWAAGYVGGARVLARVAAPLVPALAARLPGRVALGSLFYGRPWRADGPAFAQDAAALAGCAGFAATAASFAGHRFPAGDRGALDEVPVTLVWGTRDRVLPFASQGARARAALPDARHVVLPGAGHVPFVEEPHACAAALLA